METRVKKVLVDEKQDASIRTESPLLPLFLTKKSCGGIRWKTGQAFNRIAQTLHNSYCEKLHPWLLRRINRVYICLDGIEKLVPIVKVTGVSISHFLALPFWYLYLFNGFSSLEDRKIPLITVVYQAVFVFISLLLAAAFHILRGRLKKTDPEADLIEFCLEYVEQLPPGLRIICVFAAYFILGVGYVILYSLVFLCGIYLFLFSSQLFGWLRMLLILCYSAFKGMYRDILEVLESKPHPTWKYTKFPRAM